MEKLKTYKTKTPEQMKYTYPVYDLKMEYNPGTWGWDEWENGESNCTDCCYYLLPDGTEYAVFKICTRTMTGKKKERWETWHNGRFSNNHFTHESAVEWIDGYIRFTGLPGTRVNYRVRAYY